MALLLFILLLVGSIAFVGVIVGVFYVTPKMRRRYELRVWRKRRRR